LEDGVPDGAEQADERRDQRETGGLAAGEAT
jgi:hypothetical protein